MKRLWWEAGIVAASTIGAGMFSLPYVFSAAGWLLGIFYTLALGIIIIGAHTLYFKTLEANKDGGRLISLVRRYFGEEGFAIALIIFIGGLLLALVAHLILAGKFLYLIFPAVSPIYGIIGFWIFASLPILLNLKKAVGAEFIGVFFICAIIIFVFFSSDLRIGVSNLSSFRLDNFFTPFAALLFSLAGWTAVEPIREYDRRLGKRSGVPIAPLIAGTALTMILYLLFIVGISGSAGMITADTLSGLGNWTSAKLILIAVLGLLAMWASYIPIGREVRNLLEKDLKWPPRLGFGAVFIAPVIFLALGLSNFITVIGLVGGVFLSLQYVLIILVARRALRLGPALRNTLALVSVVFIAAALYEVYKFVLS